MNIYIKLIGIFIFFSWFYFVYVFFKYLKLNKTVTELYNKKFYLEEDIKKFKKKMAEFSKYQSIIEVEAEIEEKLKELDSVDSEIKLKLSNAESKIEKEKEEIKQLKKDIKLKKKELEDSVSKFISEATIEAGKIIEEANERAIEIGGDALEAFNNAKHYEEAAKAMKNIVNGYGDDYLVPNKSVLDDLAEEYSFKEAGAKLKLAREKSKQMSVNRLAAQCDYAEPKRKETAIRFVIDAFNGKVDSILSTVKHNNFGKLKQQIVDAYSITNHNGSAFRNARITPEYLESRLNELKWAVRTNVLQLEEREEQKRIKEAIREEEKARREYEKAIKEAEKEERMLAKAMEKAKAELAKANKADKEKYEAQLKELEDKLKEAEEKNQRAISMAQQTRRGHVYVISNVGSFGDDVYKIGLTRRLEPMDRVKELGDASVPFAFDVHAMIFHGDAPALEKELHKQFEHAQVNKVNPRKEFFKVGIHDIKELINEMGIEAKWTLAAEAKEYRESIAIENKKQFN